MIKFNKLIFFFRYLFRKKSKHKRQNCLYLINHLTGDLIKDLDIKQLKHFKISTYFSSIGLYSQKLKLINLAITNENDLSSDIVVKNKHSTDLDNFFTDENGYYVNNEKLWNEFRINLIRTLELLEESDNSDYGYFEYLKRQLKNILIDLEDILNVISKSILE